MVDGPDTFNILYDSALAVAQHALTPLDTRQVAVERPLDPLLPPIIHVGKAQDMAGNRSRRIVATVLPK